jgi:hypothetical protein
MTTPNGDSEEKRRLLIANYDDPILNSDLLRDYDSVISADFSDSRLALVVVKSWSWPRMQNTLFGIWIVERFFKDFDIDNRSRIPSSELLGESDETPQRKLLIAKYGDPILQFSRIQSYDSVVAVDRDSVTCLIVKNQFDPKLVGGCRELSFILAYFSQYAVDDRTGLGIDKMISDEYREQSFESLDAPKDDRLSDLFRDVVDEFGRKAVIKMLEDAQLIYRPQVLTIDESDLNPANPCLLEVADDIKSHRIAVVRLSDGTFTLIKSDAGDSPIPRTISFEEYEALLSNNPPTIHREALLTLLRACDGNANSQRGFGWNLNQLGTQLVFGDSQFPHESPLRPVPMQPGFFRPTASTIAAGIPRTGEQVLMPKSFVSDGVAEVGITATEMCIKNATRMTADEPRQKKLLILSHATSNPGPWTNADLYDAVLLPEPKGSLGSFATVSKFHVLKSDIDSTDAWLDPGYVAEEYEQYQIDDRSGLNIARALKMVRENLRQEKKKDAQVQESPQKKLKLAIIAPGESNADGKHDDFDAIEVATPFGEGDVVFTNVKLGPPSGVEHERTVCVRSNDLDWLSSIYRDYEIHDLTETKSGKRLIDAVEALRNRAD